jgi:hypothetical protein
MLAAVKERECVFHGIEIFQHSLTHFPQTNAFHQKYINCMHKLIFTDSSLVIELKYQQINVIRYKIQMMNAATSANEMEICNFLVFPP